MSEPKQRSTKRPAGGASEPTREPRRRDRAATEAALVAAAAAIFAERGYGATSTKAIAKRAGCSEALIQIYFKGKEGLLSAAIYQETSAVMDRSGFFERALCDDFEEEAQEILAFVVEMLADRSAGIKIVMSRALFDAGFRMDATSSVRHFLRVNLGRRFEQYVTAKRLPQNFDVARAAEMVLALGFTLGFIDCEVFRADATERKRRLAVYAAIFGRGVASPA